MGLGKTKRVTFMMSQETYDTILKMASETDSQSVAGVIRKALKLYKFMNDERVSGKSIVSRDNKTKKEKELVGY